MVLQLRILLVSSSSGSRGGGELFLPYLGKALVCRGHTVGLWASLHDRMHELANRFGRIGDVIRSDYRNTYDYRTRVLATCLNTLTSRRIAAEWVAWSPDVVHINKQNLEDGLDLLRAVDRTALPSVCTIHITQSARFLQAHAARLRDCVSRYFLCRYGGCFVAVQSLRHAELVKFIGKPTRQQSCLINNGVPVPTPETLGELRTAARNELGLRADEFLVLAVGRMVAQKQPLQFLQLASRISARMPGARFVWVGEGNLSREWDDWLESRRLKAVVTRVAWQSNVLRYYAAADLFLHVAKYEGLPFALLEAMAAGLPCAVSNALAQELSFLDDHNSIRVDESDSWLSRLKDQEPLGAISREARAFIQQNLSVEQMAGEYEALYERVHAGKIER